MRLALFTLFLGPSIVACSEEKPPLIGSDTGTDGPVIDGTIPGDAANDQSDARVFPPATCLDTVTFASPGTLIPTVSTSADDLLGTVTADELSIAWMTAANSVSYADRTSVSSPFGATQTFTGSFDLAHVALSGDGLTLVVVLPGHAGFGQVKRTSRSAQFSGALDSKPFDQLLQKTENDAAPTASYDDPVLSNDGKFFYYTRDAALAFSLGESHRDADTDPWLPGRFPTETEFAQQGTKRRRPTGVAPDALTLLYWDETTNTGKMAWRKALVSGYANYTTFVDIGARHSAQVNAACKRLYFGEGSPLDMFFADAK